MSGLQSTVTAAVSLLVGVGMGVSGLYFWLGRQWRASRKQSAETDIAIQGITLAHDKLVSDEVKRTAEWQSDLFHKRQEELERQMTEMKTAMHILHKEHMDCLRRDKIKDGMFEAQTLRMTSQEKEMADLRSEIGTLRGLLYSESRMLDQMRSVAKEVLEVDAVIALKKLRDAEAASALSKPPE